MSKLFKAPSRGTIGIFVNIKESEKGQYAQFKISKQYKPKDSDEWKESNIYFLDDLLALRAEIDRAVMYAANEIRPPRDMGNGEAKSAPAPKQQAEATYDADDIPF